MEICQKKKQLESSGQWEEMRTYFQSLTLYSPLQAPRKLVPPHSGAPNTIAIFWGEEMVTSWKFLGMTS